MCGRFYTGPDFREKLNELLLLVGAEDAVRGASAEGAGLSAVRGESAAAQPAARGGAGANAPAGDVFPSTASTVICGRSGRIACTEMKWGFENPYRKGLVINARAESAGEKTLFQESLAKRRCIIPASGFYEWDSWKARFRFTRPDESLILLAGIYRPEAEGERYTILTTDANPSMAPVHDRMPVMIEPGELAAWIFDARRTPEFLARPQGELARMQDEGQIRLELGEWM